MVIKLIGVIEDGTEPAPWLKTDAREAVELHAGRSTTLVLRVVTRCGLPVELAGGESLILTARSSTVRPSRLFFTIAGVAAPDLGREYYRFTIANTATQYLGGERGVYDVVLRRSGFDDTVIPTSALYIGGAALAGRVRAPAATVPAAASQDATERSFTWTATATATTQTVTIPGGGMVDASYAIASFTLRDPAPGDGAHPDARFPTAGRLAGSFTVEVDAPIRAGSVYDVVLRDRGV